MKKAWNWQSELPAPALIPDEAISVATLAMQLPTEANMTSLLIGLRKYGKRVKVQKMKNVPRSDTMDMLRSTVSISRAWRSDKDDMMESDEMLQIEIVKAWAQRRVGGMYDALLYKLKVKDKERFDARGQRKGLTPATCQSRVSKRERPRG